MVYLKTHLHKQTFFLWYELHYKSNINIVNFSVMKDEKEKGFLSKTQKYVKNMFWT